MKYPSPSSIKVFVLLFLSCTPSKTRGPVDSGVPTDSGDPADTAEPCDYDNPVLTTLSYTDEAPDGVSAEDLFGWAILPFEENLFWDDDSATRISITPTPGEATLTTTGPLDVCGSPSLGLHVTIAATTADERLALTYETDWFAEETNDVGHLGSVDASAALTAETMGVEPLAEGSTATLIVRIDQDDGLLVWLVESWYPAEYTRRVCTRASMDADDLGCEDYTEDTGLGDQ